MIIFLQTYFLLKKEKGFGKRKESNEGKSLFNFQTTLFQPTVCALFKSHKKYYNIMKNV
jgi:hypothetical protein